jgi:hypothetical protein
MRENWWKMLSLIYPTFGHLIRGVWLTLITAMQTPKRSPQKQISTDQEKHTDLSNQDFQNCQFISELYQTITH